MPLIPAMEGKGQEKGGHERLSWSLELGEERGKQEAAASAGVRDQACACWGLSKAAAKPQQHEQFEGQDRQSKFQQNPIEGLFLKPGENA